MFAEVTEGRLRRQVELLAFGEVSEGFRMWYAEVLDGGELEEGWSASNCPLSLRSQSLQPSYVFPLAHFLLSVNKPCLFYLLNSAQSVSLHPQGHFL